MEFKFLHNSKFQSGCPMKKSAKQIPRYPPSIVRKSSQPISLQNQLQPVVPTFMLFGFELGEHQYLPTSKAIGNYIEFGSKRLITLNSF